ncbi:MAG: P-loop NTPase [Candidatus Micrarchaeota archaeon]|nr:P-loop NTPase [Candidatus Micrarchaeota archaeon]
MGEQDSSKGMHPSFAGVIQQRARLRDKLARIKHKIGVYSAKGGVGKTTVAVNLAYTLSKMGKSVGLLDADIDCPNLPMFLGIEERIDTSSVPFKPVVKEGVRVASTAMLIDEASKPIIWRGPMITKMLGEMFEGIDWGELDYLIIDLSPGTSDAPLTIMQLLHMDGFVIVTTPQKIASVNSGRSGLMARKLNVSLLGVVENMSGGAPSSNTNELLGVLGTDLLGTVSLDDNFNRLSDSGKVPVLHSEKIRKEFEEIARKLVS